MPAEPAGNETDQLLDTNSTSQNNVSDASNSTFEQTKYYLMSIPSTVLGVITSALAANGIGSKTYDDFYAKGIGEGLKDVYNNQTNEQLCNQIKNYFDTDVMDKSSDYFFEKSAFPAVLTSISCASTLATACHLMKKYGKTNDKKYLIAALVALFTGAGITITENVLCAMGIKSFAETSGYMTGFDSDCQPNHGACDNYIRCSGEADITKGYYKSELSHKGAIATNLTLTGFFAASALTASFFYGRKLSENKANQETIENRIEGLSP